MSLFSCNDHDFEKLDISIIDGYKGFYSVKIYPDKKAFFLYEMYHKDTCLKKVYYQGFINKNQRDSFSKKIRMIQSIKVDTFYNCSCIDCGNSSILITTKNNIIKTFTVGICQGDDTSDKLNDLIFYSLKIAKEQLKNADSLFVFESRTKQFLPPAQSQSIK